MKPIAFFSRSLSKGRICLVHQAVLTALICAVAAPASAQTASPEAAPAKPEVKTPTLGPTREIKLADNTWFRFGFQVQAWVKAAQDLAKQPDGSDGGYAYDIYCRRCRLFSTGSIVKDVTYNILFEAGNFGRANATTGDKGYAPGATLQILDGYGMVRFVDGFQLMAGSMVVPLTRNGNQPTTTYLPIDVGTTSATLLGQPGLLNILRDLGVQADGYLAEDHLEYRLGVFQGFRAPAATGQSAGHNPPLVNAMVQYNFWDTEKGYVWGGHYYGTKKILGLLGSFQYQKLRKADGPLAGIDKNPFLGFSGAAFINYPLSGRGDPRGGDEIVALAQFAYYDGGTDPNDLTKAPTYSAIRKQTDYLVEAAYYNKDAKISVFGKFEYRKLSSSFDPTITQLANTIWIAGGLKYYIAPANLCNVGIQYERIQLPDATSTAASGTGTNNVTVQMQFLLF